MSIQYLLCLGYDGPYPVGIWCQNDVVLTLMRRHHVASTFIRRHFLHHVPAGTGYMIIRMMYFHLKIDLFSLSLYLHLCLHNYDSVDMS